MPESDLVIYEEPTESGPFGAKGVGVRLKELPLTREGALAALKSKGVTMPGMIKEYDIPYSKHDLVTDERARASKGAW